MDCDTLAKVALGPNTTVLSAAPSQVNPPGTPTPAPPPTPLSDGCETEIDTICPYASFHDRSTCSDCIHQHAKALVNNGCPKNAAVGFPACLDYCMSERQQSVPAVPAVKRTKQAQGRQAAAEAVGAIAYCLVKVLVQPAINIWVGLPSDGSYNGRFQALGGGGYAGSVREPTSAIVGGYVGASTDTGHKGSDGSFGMLQPGVPNTPLQADFAYRSEHMMAVVSKQLIKAYYGQTPEYSYWNGCSTGGRQGLMMAQRYPGDYDGVLAGAPAIHWDKFQAYQIWPQLAMRSEAGGPISSDKQDAATAAAVRACDALDGVVDGVLRDPRACAFDAHNLTTTVLTPGEAEAMNKIWGGSRDSETGELLWYGIKRGASMSGLAGAAPFPISVAQPKYWVYLDPSWDWQSTLSYGNYAAFFDKTTQMVNPVIGTDYPDLTKFKARGGKLVMWHGWSDQLIMPEGSVDYYNEVVRTTSGGDLNKTQEFARLFMAPGTAHCGMRTDGFFDAVVKWVEHGQAPDTVAHQVSSQTVRPLCPHPAVAIYKGTGSTDDAANFFCGTQGVVQDDEDATRRGNQRVFGAPFLPVPVGTI